MMTQAETTTFFLARELASAVETHNTIARVRYFTRALLRENARDLTRYGEVFLDSVEAGLGGDLYELALASRLVVEEETVFTFEARGSSPRWVNDRRNLHLRELAGALSSLAWVLNQPR